MDSLLLGLLLLLLRRLERMAQAWHAARLRGEEPLPEDFFPYTPRAFTPEIRLPTDGTHIALASRRQYVFGPGPGLGLRPRPRTTPIPCPRLARAPPQPRAGPRTSQRDRHPRRQIEAAQGGHGASP